MHCDDTVVPQTSFVCREIGVYVHGNSKALNNDIFHDKIDPQKKNCTALHDTW